MKVFYSSEKKNSTKEKSSISSSILLSRFFNSEIAQAGIQNKLSMAVLKQGKMEI